MILELFEGSLSSLYFLAIRKHKNIEAVTEVATRVQTYLKKSQTYEGMINKKQVL